MLKDASTCSAGAAVDSAGGTTFGHSTVPYSVPYSGGTYCNQCGTWASSGTYHVCGAHMYYATVNRDEILDELKAIRRIIEGKQYAELATRVEQLEKLASTADDIYPEWQQP